MKNISSKSRPRLPLLLKAALAVFCLWVPSRVSGQEPGRHLDLIIGADFNYRDINYVRQWDVLLNINPAFKWDLGHNWMFSGKVVVPVLNQYGNDYERTRVDMAVLSKSFWINGLYGKASAGWFSMNRYGIDTKWFMPFSAWVAAEAQVGYTGFISMTDGLATSPIDRLTWTLGGDIYFTGTNCQLRCVIGRFVYNDVGLYVEAMRHFRHTSVSLFAKYSDADDLDAGFKAIVMLPPYRESERAIRIRPASNFRFTNIIKYHVLSNRMYATDPEENEREGWFDRHFLYWGVNAADLEPDNRGHEAPKWDPLWDQNWDDDTENKEAEP